MSHARPGLTTCSQYDAALHALSAARQRWAETSVNRRLALLRQIKDARRHCPGVGGRGSGGQRVAGGRSAGGEEWLAGPCALMVGCNGLIATRATGGEDLSAADPLRTLADARRCGWCPARSGIGCFCLVFALRYGCSRVTWAHLDRYAARAYDIRLPRGRASWRWCLAPAMWPRLRHWMCYKLFIENQVCLLKLNPVNDYLHDLLAAPAPVIAMDALRIVTGDARAGAWLTTHPAVDEIHITGSRETHDVIVWGEGETSPASGRRDAAEPASGDLGAGRRQPHHYRTRAVERGGHRFQAQQLATQKMNNGGFNCVASRC